MQKIKKDDMVFVLKGKDRGETGRVFRVFCDSGKALVEGINYVKKHARRTSSGDAQSGGIIQKESPMRLSNLALWCKTCKKPVRVGFSVLADGTKTKYCKQCKEAI